MFMADFILILLQSGWGKHAEGTWKKKKFIHVFVLYTVELSMIIPPKCCQADSICQVTSPLSLCCPLWWSIVWLVDPPWQGRCGRGSWTRRSHTWQTAEGCERRTYDLGVFVNSVLIFICHLKLRDAHWFHSSAKPFVRIISICKSVALSLIRH